MQSRTTQEKRRISYTFVLVVYAIIALVYIGVVSPFSYAVTRLEILYFIIGLGLLIAVYILTK